jgi:hypothetical protein
MQGYNEGRRPQVPGQNFFNTVSPSEI